ncbi:MAG: hypothetical protein HY561_11555 [Gemmatimonadetes bacterium]|nr:hypothetical protein [Gemmatimonadota bacterium]
MSDAGARAILVLDDGSPEARLALEWCRSALEEVWAVPPPRGAELEALRAATEAAAALTAERVVQEGQRARARLLAIEKRALLAHPANKTVLLLSGTVPPEPLLPLGDLYASQIARFAGGWSGPPAVRALAERAGGIDALDGALARLIDEGWSEQEALAPLPSPARRELLTLLAAGRFARARAGLIPKLGAGTIGIDFFG